MQKYSLVTLTDASKLDGVLVLGGEVVRGEVEGEVGMVDLLVVKEIFEERDLGVNIGLFRLNLEVFRLILFTSFFIWRVSSSIISLFILL
jgi:hypothetical protein